MDICHDCIHKVDASLMQPNINKKDIEFCKRYPPTLIQVFEVHPISKLPVPIMKSMLPQTLPYGACGEFQTSLAISA